MLSGRRQPFSQSLTHGALSASDSAIQSPRYVLTPDQLFVRDAELLYYVEYTLTSETKALINVTVFTVRTLNFGIINT